jgi:flagellar hook-length control protein FliK
MELLTALPPDLAVLADPSARGAAPLLRPPDAEGTSPAAATPFELCLVLLTGALPSGEVWPPGGKELPVVPLDAEPDSGSTGELVPDPALVFAPAALADAAVQARVRPGASPQAVLPAAVALPLPTAEAAIETSSTSTSAAAISAAPAPPALAELDALAALAANVADSTPLATADGPIAGAAVKPTPAPSWLEAFAAHERRAQRPPAAPSPSELRAIAEAVRSAAAGANTPSAAVTAAAATMRPAQTVAQRGELPKTLPLVAAAESPSVSATDWLPPATNHGAAPSAASTPAAALPQTPVDTRAPGWHEALTHRVQVLVDTEVGEARIKLNPPELGAVDVKISLVDDKTYVQLTTATAAARDELTQSLPRLRELFTVSGLELGGASVHGGRDGQPQGGHGYDTATPTGHSSPFAAFAGDDADTRARAPRGSLGRIDVFA